MYMPVYSMLSNRKSLSIVGGEQSQHDFPLKEFNESSVQAPGHVELASWQARTAASPRHRGGLTSANSTLAITSSSISVDSCNLADRHQPILDQDWKDSNFLLRVKARARKVRGQSEIGRGSHSSTIVSVSNRCKKQSFRERRCSKKYIQDLLTFAVNTGRITETCARVLSGLLVNTNSDTNENLRALVACATEESSTAASTPKDSIAELDDSTGANNDPLLNPLLGSVDSHSQSANNDADAVLREVRFRKQYLEDGVRGFAGRTPLDPPPVVVDPRRACEPRRELAALSLADARVGTRDINRAGTLEDLLSRYERLIGTPPANVQSNVHKTAVAVRQLSKAICVHEAVFASPRGDGDIAETDPRLSRARRRESSELYRRLARALDQRVPPEQRLFRSGGFNEDIVNVSTPQPEVLLPLWVRTGRLTPSGSRIFGTETRLSDFQDDTD